jgi:hypothetical protein
MFGISSFSEAPFSGIVDTRDAGWQEIRNNVDTWVQSVIAQSPVYSLSLNFVTGSYEVVDTLFEYDSLWKSASAGANTWVVR